MTKETKQKEVSESAGKVKEFIQKLSRGLMIPIALLPLAGLFLGVGAGFENVVKQAGGTAEQAYFFTVFKMIGDAIFGNLPLLFCLGVSIAFSDDIGVAVFSGALAWITFNATQSTMIWAQNNEAGELISYNIAFWQNVPTSVVATNLGIVSMQTSVFGGILMGFWAAFMYNKFHTFQMPKVLGFFSGTRFVPIITFLTVPLWGFAFLMIWPMVGIGLDKFGQALGATPYGIDAFVFGVVERSLIPFGLHHAFYAPLWYTSVGGSLYAITDGATSVSGTALGQGDQGVWFAMQTAGIPFTVLHGIGQHAPAGWALNLTDGETAVGTATSIAGYDIIYHNGNAAYAITNGINPGQYQQGKFPFMLFGLPAAAAAMIMAAKKENRELAMSVIGAAGLTSFLTGITEPIEFTFLFLAPYLYYGFHIWMAGISFWALDGLGSHVGMTFSGGIFDYVLFGIIPDATGLGSNSFWIPIIGVIYAPIYYFVFYFVITKMDVKTPGREGTDVVMISKADYKAAKASGKNADKAAEREARVEELLGNLGGMENLDSIEACITRLRLSVKDRDIINEEGLKAMGAMGVVGKGKAIQVIFGAEADQFKVELQKLRKEMNK